MSDLVTNITEPVTLTDQLIEIFEYYTDKSKTYTKDEIKSQIEEYSKDLQLTKDQLNELIKSLDGLDFVEDGKVDVDALVAKIAKIEAVANTNTNDIKTINDEVKQQKADIDNLKTTVSNLDPENTSKDIQDLKEKVDDLDKRVTANETAIKNLQVDVDKIKTILTKFF